VSKITTPGHVGSHRLLHKGKVEIVRARRGRMIATVADHGLWTVEFRGGRWTCDCPLPAVCPHVGAVGIVSSLSPSDRPRCDVGVGDDDEE
jgi:uncharacterized Zn finger protein